MNFRFQMGNLVRISNRYTNEQESRITRVDTDRPEVLMWPISTSILKLLSSGIWRRVAWRIGVNDSGEIVFPLSTVSSDTLKIESTCSFETLVPIYQATRCHMIKRRILTFTGYLNLQCGLGSMYGPLNLGTLLAWLYLPTVNVFKSPSWAVDGI